MEVVNQSSRGIARLCVSMKGEAESGCSHARRGQERQAKALRKAATEALWQGKAVDEENQAQWSVLARVVAMRKWQERGWDLLREVEDAAGEWSSLEDKTFEVERRKAFEERLEKAAQGAAGKLHKWTKPVAVW